MSSRSSACPDAPPAPEAGGALDAALRELHPGSFAFVMATGIVSVASRLDGLELVAQVLFGLASLGYTLLWLLTILRLARYPAHVVADLSSHARGPGFLTIVAATCIIGAQLAPLDLPVAAGLWLLAALLWCGLTYAVLATVAVRPRKPALEVGLRGSWMLVVVATQALAGLGVLVAAQFGAGQAVVQFIALEAFLGGCLLYLMLVGLMVLRIGFLRLQAADLTPDYWISMGAAAISTLTGATLIAAAGRSALVQQLLPFLTGLTLLLWAGATWWLPLLVLLEGWRHLARHIPLVYGPEWWALVFPVGMYVTCTFELARALRLDGLLVIPHGLVFVALGVWLLAFIGLLHHLARRTFTVS